MATTDAKAATTTQVRFRLPDPPEREPDEVSSIDHLHGLGHSMHLARYLGRPESTLVTAERWIAAFPGYRPLRRPDLMIAFDVDPNLYDEQNGYVISDQDKPPDFILEVASPSTAHIDTVDKRREYAELGVTEYWRFDHTGESHGTRLAGDRLVGERYEPIPVVELSPEVWQGESEVLGLWLRWEHGTLGWYDPATGQHIPTFDAEREGRLAERERRLTEREGRLAAEARVRELEEELRRLRQP
jgi:hypothetical protein